MILQVYRYFTWTLRFLLKDPFISEPLFFHAFAASPEKDSAAADVSDASQKSGPIQKPFKGLEGLGL